VKKLIFAVIVLVVSCFLTSIASADLNDGLVAYYPFNGNADDESGNGHNGTVSGASLAQDQFGEDERAYSFDGVNDYINIGNHLKPPFPFTIVVWVKMNSVDSFASTVFESDLWNSGGQGYYGANIAIGAGGSLGGWYGDGGYAGPLSRRGKGTFTSHPIMTDKWQHVAVKFNAHLDMDLYVDGQKQESNWDNGTGGTMAYSANHVGTIGAHIGDTQDPYWFDGSMSEVRVYNRSLSDAEILMLYCEGSPNACTIGVMKDGTGSGSVISFPLGIDCGIACTAQSACFDTGSIITLTASADPGSVFSGWSGAGCSGTGTCQVTMNSDLTVTASFALANAPTEVSPKEGTIGTEVTITGSDFSARKGKVLIGGKSTKIAKNGWDDAMIAVTVTKVPLPPDMAYDVTIVPKTTSSTTLPDAFTVKSPELDLPLALDHGTPDTPITITGRFFSTKKGKVYLEDSVTGKKKTCKITNWYMDRSNGDSTLTFIVPKLPKGFAYGVAYPLKIANKVGVAETTFTVEP